MKLTGIIEDVFRGVTIFRGYSTLKTLAKMSASTSYQRNHEENRVGEIEDYMIKSSFVFFPEIILGWQIEEPDVIRKIKQEESINSITVENGIKIKKAKYKFKRLENGEEPKTKLMTIEIPDNLSITIFNRIDGNHRLAVVDKTMQDEEPNQDVWNQIVPFCLIIQEKRNESEKYEAAYFYLINSKGKPLTTDENLKALLGKELFSPIEKESLLALNSVQVSYIEELVEYISEHVIDFIDDIFNKEYYSFSLKFIRNVINTNDFFEKECLERLKNTIKYINSLYLTKQIVKFNRDTIFATILKYYKEESQIDKFLHWINKNEVDTIQDLSYSKIIELFDNIHKQRTYKVFVAMPYISFKRVNEYNTLFKEILFEISQKIGFGLELIPIMRFKGATQRIDWRLIEKIKECDIFIGDLTTCNNNVIFEIGLAEGCGKQMLLIKAEEDTDKIPFDEASNLDKGKIIPFDMDKLQYISYSNSGYYNNIKSIMRNNIPIIVEQLKKHNI